MSHVIKIIHNRVLYWLNYDWTHLKNNRWIDDFSKAPEPVSYLPRKYQKNKVEAITLSKNLLYKCNAII